MTWGTALDVRQLISADALWRAGQLVGIQTWPSVLDLGPRFDTVDAYQRALREAEAELRDAGLLGVEGVDDSLHFALQTVAAPQSQLQARVYGEAGVRRISLTRHGFEHVLVLQYGDSCTLETVAVDGTASAAARVSACLGDVGAANVGAVSLPTDELARRLDEATDAADYAETLYAMGVDQRESAVFGAAFGECSGFTEIVAAESHHNGTQQQSSGAVVIYETARGRVVASPSMSPDGLRWTTLSAGSGHRIRQAIGLLVETLPSGRWMP